MHRARARRYGLKSPVGLPRIDAAQIKAALAQRVLPSAPFVLERWRGTPVAAGLGVCGIEGCGRVPPHAGAPRLHQSRRALSAAPAWRMLCDGRPDAARAGPIRFSRSKKGWPLLVGRSSVFTHIGDACRADGLLPIAMPVQCAELDRRRRLRPSPTPNFCHGLVGSQDDRDRKPSIRLVELQRSEVTVFWRRSGA